MSVNHQNNFATNLSSNTSAGVTTTPLDSIPTIDAPFYIALDATNINGNYEVLKCSAKTATNVNHPASSSAHTTAEEVRMVAPATEFDDWSTYMTGIRTPVASTPAGAATDTLDVEDNQNFKITMPAGNITIAISNEEAGKVFTIGITQDGTGSRTVTWFSTIRWAGGSAPTLTTTASKRDVFGFICTGTDTYDGFVVGQNL